ncbi:histone-lysine N-methyltransferase SETMAR [Trichonephila clavipes]|nr:histone-lysine N-methyltransferase SETMAR [Trichonephila clavipes]
MDESRQQALVYADKPQTLDHLEDNIRRVIADIRPQMLEKVIENWTSRLDYIRASRGSPMPEILFKISEGGWSATEESVGSVARRTLNNKKVLLCIWWDCRGIVFKEYLKSRLTINSTIYSEMLIEVSDAIRKKRKKEFRRKIVLFHQANAQPHISAMTSWMLFTLEWGLMQHPTYRPDMAPSD